MNKYKKYKDSGFDWIGKIPEHWKSIRLKYIGYLYGGLSGKSSKDFNQSSNPDNKPFIPFTNIANNKVIDPNQLQYVVIKEDEKQNQVQKGDLFFMMSSENYEDVGKSTILLDDLGEAYLNSFCKGFRFTEQDYFPTFINYLLLSQPYRSLLQIEANGFTRINLKIDKVNDLSLKVPPFKEQTAIADYLDRKTAEIDELIADKKRLLELYEEEKTAIINQAVTKGLPCKDARTCVSFKDSGIEWLGKIPEHWEVKKLKYVITKAGSGVTPRGGASVYLTSGIPLLRSQNIHFDGLRLDDVAYISEITHNKMSNSQVLSGDVLLNITGASIGRCFYITDKLGEANVNQHVCIIRPKDNLFSQFLYFILRSFIGQVQINYEQTGSGREGLNFEALKDFRIPNIEIKEQTAIVQYIETEIERINTKVEKTKKLIDLLIEYRTSLISEVVTGKIKVI